MSELLQQIDADARVRLAPRSELSLPDVVRRCQEFLRFESHRVRLAHRRGGAGKDVCRAQARIWDSILASLLPACPVGDLVGWALVALGGYGRSEVSPGSEVRLMILFERDSLGGGDPRQVVAWFASPPLVPLFQNVRFLGRTVFECQQEAETDSRFTISLIDARLVAGEPRVFAGLREILRAWGSRGQDSSLIVALLAEQEAQRAKFGSAVCVQEPHIKHGCGGLRDYQSVQWLAFAVHNGLGLTESVARGLLLESERIQLDAAYDFLLRVRNEAHYQSGRCADLLTKHLQPRVAHGLGYAERSLSRRIERFMRDYYRHARSVHLLTRSLQERLLLSLPLSGLRSGERQVGPQPPPSGGTVDGFQIVGGRLRAMTNDVFRQDPIRLMRVFRHAQQRGLELDPGLVQLARQEAGQVGEAFRSDPGVARTFLEILNQRGEVARVLRAMHEVGLLGAYLPPFGKLTCLVQHEFFHRYTADEHTLVCLEKLDEIALARDSRWAAYTDLLAKSVEHPYLLYLALVLHDAGKARADGNHAESGGRIAASVARQLGLDASSATTLRFLVRHHLAMVVVSQRRDLDEPAEIRRFASLVESVHHLNMLTLLTIADSLGTSDDLWNGFKNALLMTLYWRTREVLVGGARFLATENRRRERVAPEVRALLPAAFPADEVAAHFALMPARYFPLREAEVMVADLQLAHRFFERIASPQEDPLEPVALWQDELDRGYSVVRVATWDRAGLFSRICGSLTAAGLDILSAEIFTRGDSIAIDAFSVVEAGRGTLVGATQQELFARYLREAVCAGTDLGDLIRARRAAQPAHEPGHLEPLPTAIRFDNHTAETRTVIEIETEDRVGLLYAIAQALWFLGLDISVAKICTERGAAFDSFYVCTPNGLKIESPAQQKEVATRLRAAIVALT